MVYYYLHNYQASADIDMIWVIGNTCYMFLGSILIWYFYSYIIQQSKILNKPKLYIVRRLPFLNIDDKIRSFIKENQVRKYRILSSYDLIQKDGYMDVRNISKYNSIILQSFIKLINRDRKDIYIMNRNLYKWEYEPYVLIAKYSNYEPVIIEFIIENMSDNLKILQNSEEQIAYKNALNDIKKYEIDNQLVVRRISV